MKQVSHLTGCVGFWLWAVVGAVVAFGVISFLGWFILVPAVALAYVVQRRAQWKDGPVLLGLITGAGVPLLLVAALQWHDWHQRVAGDNTPNPYDWGSVGIALVIAGIVAYAIARRRA